MFARLIAVVLIGLCTAAPAGAQTTSTIFGAAFTGGGAPASLYTINPTTGLATLVGPIGFNQVGGIDFSPSGTLFGVAVVAGNATLITINPVTGAGTLVGSLGVGGAAQDIAFRPSDGTLFAYLGGDVYTVNTTTGAATLIGNTGGFPDGNAIAFSGATLFLGNTQGGANGTLQTIDQATAAVTPVVAFAYGAGFTPANNPRTAGMKFDPATGTLFAGVIEGNPGSARFLATVDPGTGAVTDIGSTIAGLDAIAIRALGTTTIVPALSEWALIALFAMILGIALVTLSRRRIQPR